MDKDFLLTTDVARKLYHEVAADLPVIDYHSHLQQGEIAERKKFRNIAELWLAGDHYKWRLMRTAGVAEESARCCRWPSATRSTSGATWNCAASSAST
jgi:glucuronate isomerase